MNKKESLMVCDVRLCTGCGACKSVCPSNAIRLIKGVDGFLVPSINYSKCSDCYHCRAICPILNENVLDYHNPIQCYALQAPEEIRNLASSGGAFGLLAKAILSRGGVVYGAAFDNDLQLNHIRISALKDLPSLFSSKYIQSNTIDTFCKCKEDLEDGLIVLYVGTPCQISGLKNFLRWKNVDCSNLILVDLICHGVPSQNSFDRYMNEYNDIVEYNFRDKRDGWGSPYLRKMRLKDSTISYATDCEDSFLRAFFANINLRNSCYKCAYARITRISDITLGDFWGVPDEMNDRKGTSVILVNTNKGMDWINNIKKSCFKYMEYPVSLPEKVQPQLNHPSWRHPLRDVFLKDVESMSFSDACNKNICSNKSVALLNFHWENVNFGAVLTAFALNKFLNQNGYFAQNIDYIPSFPWIKEESPNTYFDDFRKSYLPMTMRINACGDLHLLNEYFHNFIVGSDQVWRPEFIKNEKDVYMLGFASPNKNTIAYAASFGISSLDLGIDEKREYAARIRCLDHVSVREDSAVDLCAQLGVSAKCVMDPVFLLRKEEWDCLADDYVGDINQEVVFYTIDEQMELPFQNFISSNFSSLKSRNITWNMSIQEWLCRIRGCKLILTDSYHALCFALIFNVPFIVINPNMKTAERMRSLTRILQVEQPIYNSIEEATNGIRNNNDVDCDFGRINYNIEQQRHFSIEFILNALAGGSIGEDIKRELLDRANKIQSDVIKKKIHDLCYSFWRYRVLRFISFSTKKRQKYQKKFEEVKRMKKRLKADFFMGANNGI